MTTAADLMPAFLDHLNKPSGGTELPELLRFLEAALAHVEKQCGPVSTASRTYRVYPSGQNLVLPATRLTVVTSVTDPDGNVVTVDPDDVNLLSGIISIRSYGSSTGPWLVVASSGAATVSADLRLAVLIIGAHLYETQRTNRPRRPGFDQENQQISGFGYAIPNRAAELMRPHMTPAVA